MNLSIFVKYVLWITNLHILLTKQSKCEMSKVFGNIFYKSFYKYFPSYFFPEHFWYIYQIINKANKTFLMCYATSKPITFSVPNGTELSVTTNPTTYQIIKRRKRYIFVRKNVYSCGKIVEIIINKLSNHIYAITNH